MTTLKPNLISAGQQGVNTITRRRERGGGSDSLCGSAIRASSFLFQRTKGKQLSPGGESVSALWPEEEPEGLETSPPGCAVDIGQVFVHIVGFLFCWKDNKSTRKVSPPRVPPPSWIFAQHENA